MKKLSLCFVLLLLAAIFVCPMAYADETNLGVYYVDENVYDGPLTIVYEDNFDITQPSGSGLWVVQERYGDGIGLFLSGTPTTPGNYSFSYYDAYGSYTSFYFTVDFAGPQPTNPVYPENPQTPEFYTSDNVSCTVGDRATVSVDAWVYDEGYLSYQWYYNYTGASYGGTPLAGATGAAFIPGTTSTGTTYYYCVITNNLYGRQASATTNAVSVTVNAPQIQKILMNTLPSKTVYKQGETLNTSGMSIIAYKSNGDQEVIYNGFSCNPTVFNSVGQTTVQVNYNGFTTTFNVNVEKKEAVIDSISIASMPSKITYKQGETLDTTGLVLRLNMSDGSHSDISSGFSCSPTRLDNTGGQTITVSYNGKTVPFNVTVEKGENKLEVTSTPAKLTYTAGESLDTAGLVLKLTQGSDVQMISSGFTCEPSVLNTVGTQTVTVRYGSDTATFTVEVKEAAASPSPEVKDDKEDKDGKETEKKSSNRTFLIVVMVVCIVVLIGLGAYLVYLNTAGKGRRR